MGNDPRIELVAKGWNSVTERVSRELLKNFEVYYADYLEEDLADDRTKGLRSLTLYKADHTRTEEIRVYGKDKFPFDIKSIDFRKFPGLTAHVAYVYLHINARLPKDEKSISKEYPFEFATMMLDPLTDDTKGIAKFASIPPKSLIKLDDLCLTPEEQKEFRIVAYWEGPKLVDFNHFTYDQFRKMRTKDLAKAFLYADEQGM
jgi:hypothetical protein